MLKMLQNRSELCLSILNTNSYNNYISQLLNKKFVQKYNIICILKYDQSLIE